MTKLDRRTDQTNLVGESWSRRRGTVRTNISLARFLDKSLRQDNPSVVIVFKYLAEHLDNCGCKAYYIPILLCFFFYVKKIDQFIPGTVFGSLTGGYQNIAIFMWPHSPAALVYVFFLWDTNPTRSFWCSLR